MKYWILGYGRSGTHWVSELLRTVVQSDVYFDIDQWHRSPNDSVFHTNVRADLDQNTQHASDTHLVVVKRLDLFATTCSLALANHTQEWFGYSHKNFDPIELDPDQFLITMQYQVEYYRELDTRPDLASYAKISTVVYEDLLVAGINKESYLAGLLNLDYSGPVVNRDRNINPRHYRDIIANYDMLAERYNKKDLMDRFWHGDYSRP